MKKFFSAAALFVASVFIFSACSCSACNTDARVISSAVWNKDPSSPYVSTFSETAEYDVIHVKDYKVTTNRVTYDFTAAKTDKPVAEYGKGSYVTTAKAVTQASLPSNAAKPESSEIYEYTASLTLPVKYTLGENEYSFTDTISSKVYFLSSTHALQPICSEKSYDNTKYADGKIYRYVYTVSVLWNAKAELTITDGSETAVNDYNGDENVIMRKTEKTATYKYAKGCALDNEQLLFATRGFGLSASFNRSVKVLDTAYGKLQTVGVRCASTANVTDPWALSINEAVKDVATTSAYLTTIGRSDGTYAGSPMICYYQITNYNGDDKDVTADANGRSWLVKMVTKLPSDLGALNYRLKSVTVTE